MKRILLAVTLAALLFAAPARANDATAPVCTDGLFIRALVDADTYWTKRGYVFAAPATCRTLEDTSGPMAWGEIGGSTVWWVRSYIDQVRAFIASHRREAQRRCLARVFAVAIHERGHNLGFQHSLDPRSVMYFTPAIPPMARRWARQVVAEQFRDKQGHVR